MCSIFGVFTTKKGYLNTLAAERLLKTLRDQQEHRGPDGSDIKVIDSTSTI